MNHISQMAEENILLAFKKNVFIYLDFNIYLNY